MKNLFLILALVTCISFTSCSKDDPEPFTTTIVDNQIPQALAGTWVADFNASLGSAVGATHPCESEYDEMSPVGWCQFKFEGDRLTVTEKLTFPNMFGEYKTLSNWYKWDYEAPYLILYNYYKPTEKVGQMEIYYLTETDGVYKLKIEYVKAFRESTISNAAYTVFEKK